MKELTEKIVEFTRERDWDQFHSPENLAKSISIEAGELLECFQWNNEYDLDEVKEELADVINYCLLMADKLGVDAKQIVLDKMEKTAKKYPVEKAKGVSTKYNKLQEDVVAVKRKSSKVIVTIIIFLAVSFIILFLDFSNILYFISKNFNYDFLSIFIPNIVLIFIFLITYFLIDKRNMEKEEKISNNQQNVLNIM